MDNNTASKQPATFQQAAEGQPAVATVVVLVPNEDKQAAFQAGEDAAQARFAIGLDHNN